MTHDRCSELLRGYVLGELPRELADQVRAHLGECEECRAEESVVSALMAGRPEETAPLDDLEKALLHRALAQELFTPRANADVAPAGGGAPRWTRWVAPALASAAVIAGIVVMTTWGESPGDVASEQFSAESGAEVRDDDEAAQGAAGGGDAGRSQDSEGAPGRSRALNATAEQGGTTFDVSAEVPPQFDADAGSLTTEDLSAFGRSGDLFQAFAAAYRPGDGETLYEPFLETLVKESPGLRPEIEQCAATLPRDGSLIPVYGALADYDRRDALVLGFVTSDPGSAELDRYLIWVWERGSCDQPIDSLFENIER